VIVGFGKTGVSVAEHCQRHGMLFAVADDAARPTRLNEFDAPNKPITFASLEQFRFEKNDRLVVSPGVPLSHSVLQDAVKSGLELTSDIKIFCQLRQKPLALITGSNGKSTVTHIVGQLLNKLNIKTGVGGNIGTPALDLMKEDFSAYVIEVSSYQLELADSAAADVAVLLNLSPDHLDRYAALDDYYHAKTQVFSGCGSAIYSRDLDFPLGISANTKVITFGSDAPADSLSYGIRQTNGKYYLARGKDDLVVVDDLPIKGRHNWLNVLAALAIAEAMGAELASLLTALPSISGLPHRCEIVPSKVGLIVNDSKATNPSSTLTAIGGFADAGVEITLILGGMGKGADFSVLSHAIKSRVVRCYVYGRDREQIAEQVGSPMVKFETLEECLLDLSTRSFSKLPISKSVILFSPACASLDQFANFEARGDYFKMRTTELFA